MQLEGRRKPAPVQIFFVAALLLLFAGCRRGAEYRDLPVLGREAASEVRTGLGAGQALETWRAAGLKHALLLHAAPESGLEPPEAAAGRITARNYVAAAAAEGIFDRVVWVMPQGFWRRAGTGAFLKRYLALAEGFPRAELASFRMEGGCLSGHLRGLELRICAPYTAPPVAEPVVLDLSPAFFPVYAATKEQGPLAAIKTFFDILGQRGYRLRSVRIAEPEPGTLAPPWRLIGDWLAGILRDPGLLKKEPPVAWQAVEGAATLLARGDAASARVAVSAGREADPQNAVFDLLAAAADAGEGRTDAALAALTGLCGRREDLCDAFLYVGWLVLEKEGAEAAEPYYRKALSIRPDWPLARRKFADRVLIPAGRLEEAWRHYAASGAPEGVDVMLRQGDLAFRLGRLEEARKAYRAALERRRKGGGWPPSEENRTSLERMRGLFDGGDDATACRTTIDDVSSLYEVIGE